MESKTIYGQAWISGDSLLQEQYLVIPGKETYPNIVALIPNIWNNLRNPAEVDYPVKNNGKGYFYWEYKMSDTTTGGDTEVTVKIECPQPKPGLFNPPYTINENASDWEKYWLEKLNTALENAKKSNVIQRGSVTFPGTSYVDQNGDTVTLNDYVYTNNDLGDIENLLRLY